jgi:hypothetical protein
VETTFGKSATKSVRVRALNRERGRKIGYLGALKSLRSSSTGFA